MRPDHLALYTVPAIVLALFAVLRPRTAVIAAFIGAWLFLPMSGITIAGLPNYTKVTATSASVLLGIMLFDPGRLLALRPRWYDVPIVVRCLVPLASSLDNGLGLYDGLSAVTYTTATWGLPYLIGRAYLTDLEGLRALAVGIVIGGLIYVPLCLFEVRFSPQLHPMVYGYRQHVFRQTLRGGGYRPMVFMQHGLAVGLWMAGATVVGTWLWASGVLKRLGGLPFGGLLVVLAATAILCKSTGASVLMAVGVTLRLAAARPVLARLGLAALVLAPPVYMATRIPGVVSGEFLVEQARAAFGDERAGSLSTRVLNEDRLAARALERPVFGWGGWGRARVRDESGRDITITDGLWIIVLGSNGLVGLTALTTVLLLPPVLLWWRAAPSTWRRPEMAPAAALACLLTLYMIDNLLNNMFNPVYMLAAGGLMGLDVRGAGRSAPGPLLARGRSLKERGRLADAAAAWRRALAGWGEPTGAENRRAWAAAHNDLAWLLATDPTSPAHDPAGAVRLAKAAIAIDPGCATYWNTLGLAQYRAGDPAEAVAALGRSVDLSGGSVFDSLLLAMAYDRLGDRERARACLDRVNAWIDAHSPTHAGRGDPVRARACDGRALTGPRAGPPPPSNDLLRLRAEAASLLTAGDHRGPHP